MWIMVRFAVLIDKLFMATNAAWVSLSFLNFIFSLGHIVLQTVCSEYMLYLFNTFSV